MNLLGYSVKRIWYAYEKYLKSAWINVEDRQYKNTMLWNTLTFHENNLMKREFVGQANSIVFHVYNEAIIVSEIANELKAELNLTRYK